MHFYPEKFRINDVAVRLSELGHNVKVFTGKPNYHSGLVPKKFKTKKIIIEKYKGIEIFRFPIISRGKKSSYTKRALNYFSYITNLIFYQNKIILKEFNPDYAFVYGTSPIFQILPSFFSKQKKMKVVLWYQDLWPETLYDLKIIRNFFLKRILNYLISKIYKKTDFILVQSMPFKKYMIEKGYKNKTFLYENPCEKINIRNNKINNKSKIITYGGNLGKAQNLNYLIKLGEYNKKNSLDILIKIFGEGSEKENLKKKINEKYLQNYIKVFGFLEDSKFYKELNKSDYLAISLASGEAFSRTIPAKFQTYIYFKKPIISINDGALAQYISNYNVGINLRPNKFNSDLKKYKKLISNKDNYKIYSKNAHNLYVQKYELNANVKILCDFFYKNLK